MGCSQNPSHQSIGESLRPFTLWLAIRPFGNVSRDPFQEEFADQVRHRICARAANPFNRTNEAPRSEAG